MKGKLFVILMFPIILFALIIDIFLGDLVTGTKTTVLQKINEHFNLTKKYWCNNKP